MAACRGHLPAVVGLFSMAGNSMAGAHDSARMRSDPASVAFSKVTAGYGATVALDDVSLAVEPGESVAIVGSNGSGKSTLIRCLLGLHRSSSGQISVGGHQAQTRADWAERRRQVAYVPQRPATGRFPLLVHELLASSGAPDEAEAAATQLGIGHLLHRPLDTLSGGQLQRCVLARGVACTDAGATVLAADEPTSALDFDGQEQVAELLAGLHVTLIVVTHEQIVVDRCDRVVEMAGGRLRERSRS